MILDLQTVFSGSTTAAGVTSGQALTATAISTNVVDLRNAATPATADEGLSPHETWFIVQVVTSAAGGDAAKTLTITFESATDAGLSSGNVAHFTSVAFTGAQITAGANLIRIPLPSADYKRYLGMRYTVSASFTAFQIAAFLTPDVNRNVIYASGYTVDA